MIEFSKLVINNFLSWGKEQVIPLSNQGIVRIEGVNKDEPRSDSNQAGKSAIVEALVWCLFGKTIRGLKHDSVVNRFARRNCYTKCYFHSGSQHYHVDRYRKHHKHENKLRLWAGGKLVSSRHEEETQRKVDDVLASDFSSFTNSVIFGGIRPFASLTDAEQKKVLESFLHFERFDLALERTKRLLSKSKEELSELRLEMETEKGNAKAFRERFKALRKSEAIVARKMRKEIAETKSQLEALGSKSVSLVQVSAALKDKDARHERLVSNLSAVEERARLARKQLGSLHATSRDKEKLLGQPCPTCARTITRDVVEACLKHVLNQRKKLREELFSVEKIVARSRKEVSYGRRELIRLREKLHQLRVSHTVRTELERRIGLATRSLNEFRFSSSIFKASRAYSKSLSRLLVLENRCSHLKQELEDLQFWIEGFGNRGIKALIVREALPALNGKLSEYAGEIFGGAAELKFVPTKQKKSGGERESLNIHYSAKRGAVSYSGESSGGKKRVDCCLLLTFSWFSRTSNILLVDELLDNLDEEGRETVLDILSGLRQTVLVISHRKELKARVGKVWTVTKQNGYSTLET